MPRSTRTGVGGTRKIPEALLAYKDWNEIENEEKLYKLVDEEYFFDKIYGVRMHLSLAYMARNTTAALR